MKKIDTAIQQLPDHDLPSGLHEHIMRRAFFIKFRSHMSALAILAFASVFFSGWHAWMRIVNLETISILRATFEGFELSTAFFGNVFETVYEFAPINAIFVFILNGALILYGLYIVRQLRSQFQRSNIIHH